MLLWISIFCSRPPHPASDDQVMANVVPYLVMRAEPSVQANLAAEVPFGSMLTIKKSETKHETLLGLTGVWILVSHSGKEGWVFAPLTTYPNLKKLPLAMDRTRKVLVPVAAPHLRGQDFVLYQSLSEGHDIKTALYQFRKQDNTVERITCSFWSGPPQTEESNTRRCGSSVLGWSHKGLALHVDAATFQWNQEVQGYVQEGVSDWSFLIAESKRPDRDNIDFYKRWTHDTVTCRFHTGDGYGGDSAPYLCEKLGYDPGCPCFKERRSR